MKSEILEHLPILEQLDKGAQNNLGPKLDGEHGWEPV